MAAIAADRQTEAALRVARGGGGRHQRADAARQPAANTEQARYTEGAQTRLIENQINTFFFQLQNNLVWGALSRQTSWSHNLRLGLGSHQFIGSTANGEAGLR